MTIIVEDGSIVPNANSYVDLAGLRAFATQRGLVVPADDTAAEALLITAMDYLEGLSYVGRRVSFDQALQWPREAAYTQDGYLIPNTKIPTQLINAQCQLAYTAQTVPLFATLPAGGKGPIMSESVYGAVSRTYGQPTSATTLAPYMGAVNNFLKGLLRGNFGYAEAIRA